MKIAVIGAGAAGLVAIKYCIQEGHECEAFEQTEFIGGTWNYTDDVGLDKNGLPVHTSMYKNLRTNLPKEVMMFENFPYPEDLMESYITQSQVLDYLNDYANKMDLRKHVRFLTLVTHVEPTSDNKWIIEVQGVENKNKEKKIFDAVVVCNGKYEVPYIPNIPGLESFTGHCIHSHDFRSVEPYKDKTVLIIGGGPSGVDISSHLNGVAKKVISSFKPTQLALKASSDLVEKPLIKRIEDNISFFADDSEEEIEYIILCTGYHYSFPFLCKICGIFVDDNYIKGIYKECLCVEFPTLIILGLPLSICPIPTFEIQMRFFIQILTGKYQLPSKEMMIQENDNARKSKNCMNRHFHRKQVNTERVYWDDLARSAGVKKVPEVVTKLHEWVFSQNRDRSQRFRILNDSEFQRIK